MARYFLHLRDGTDELLDEEGSEFLDKEALKTFVLLCARDVMAGQMKDSGTLDLRCWIDAEDERGELAYSLPFQEGVSILTGQSERS